MRGSVLFWFVLALWGCSSSDQSPSASSLWCGALCSAVQRCDYVPDLAACSSDCQSQRPTLANISVEGAGPLAACLANMNCSDLFDKERWSTAYEACWDRAKSEVTVTASVRAFCEGFTLSEFDCRYWYATDACERDFGMWNDSVRSRVASCAANPTCSEAEACTSATFDSL